MCIPSLIAKHLQEINCLAERFLYEKGTLIEVVKQTVAKSV